ncbi:hypothetical protein ADIS_4849 [Lunatimonas lonarensis]|uniref:Uncharacterized protein n=1 Tax=Lunatimonas lonarensis TaxID=1232681 RepID=R7ZKW9_9BACT|nr:hypothetical protein ADIS_4849 [Lunatimonas lonarensis]
MVCQARIIGKFFTFSLSFQLCITYLMAVRYRGIKFPWLINPV